MATPLFFFDDDLKSVTIVSQSPERTRHVIKELIKDGYIVPKDYDQVFFYFPCDIAPLEIVSTDTKKKYRTIYIISGYIGNNSYVSFDSSCGTKVVYNATVTFEILDILGIKLTDAMKRLLRDESKICDKNGFYKAKLVAGDGLKVFKNGSNNIEIKF